MVPLLLSIFGEYPLNKAGDNMSDKKAKLTQQQDKDGKVDRYTERQYNIVQPFQTLCGNDEMLSKIIELFPYPVHVYAPDGTMILTNDTWRT